MLALQIDVTREDLYVPTNPNSRIVSMIPESATPMQSAAKVPILVAFKASALLKGFRFLGFRV